MGEVSRESTIHLRPFSFFGPAFRADDFWLLGVPGGRLGGASLRGRQRDSARAQQLWESSAEGHRDSGNLARGIASAGSQCRMAGRRHAMGTMIKIAGGSSCRISTSSYPISAIQMIEIAGDDTLCVPSCPCAVAGGPPPLSCRGILCQYWK
jgi:hypothetical protein